MDILLMVMKVKPSTDHDDINKNNPIGGVYGIKVLPERGILG